jgi:site-specific DNA recombinase
MTVRAAIYCRISEDQANGWDVAYQEQHCRRLAEAMGWDVVGVYIDNDIGATVRSRKRRKDYERLCSDIAAGDIDTVLVTELSRLHRRPLEWHQFRELAKSHGLKIKSLTDSIDLATAEGVFAANLRADIDEEEAEQIRRRVQRRSLSEAREGRPHSGGTRAFGYKWIPEQRTLEIVPHEAELIREAARRLLQGESLGAVCMDWNRRGITTTTGKVWGTTQLRQMVMRVTLTGYRSHPVAGQVRGNWPAILPKGDWEQLCFLLNDPTRRNHGRVNVRSYLLTGFVYCALCGQPLRGGPNGRSQRNYYCRMSVGFSGCGRIRRLADPVDKEVIDRLLYCLDSPEVRAALAAPDDEADVNDHAEIEQARDRLVQLADDYADGTFTKAEYLRQKSRFQDRIDALMRKLAQRQSSYTLAAVSNEPIMEAWQEHSGQLDWQRALIGAVIAKVIIRPQRGRKFDPNTIEIVWKG